MNAPRTAPSLEERARKVIRDAASLLASGQVAERDRDLAFVVLAAVADQGDRGSVTSMGSVAAAASRWATKATSVFDDGEEPSAEAMAFAVDALNIASEALAIYCESRPAEVSK